MIEDRDKGAKQSKSKEGGYYINITPDGYLSH
jgi:hypothetical protein